MRGYEAAPSPCLKDLLKATLPNRGITYLFCIVVDVLVVGRGYGVVDSLYDIMIQFLLCLHAKAATGI